jgi:HK97 family phage portal protein
MNFWQRALGPIRNLVRRRDEPVRYYRWINTDAPSGIVITPETALQISVVWACVLAITNAIASCRWNIFTGDHTNRTWLAEDPLDDILNVRPNPEMPAISFREALLFGALTWGNGYAEVVRNGRGQVTALWPLMSDRMTPRRRSEKPFGLYYAYYQEDGSLVELESEDVFHLRGPGITGLMGDNLVARAAKSMGLAAAQDRYASTYFGNNTLLGGVLEYPKTLGDDAHKRLKDDWEDRYKGTFKANRPAILENGMKYTPFSNDADKAQMNESRQFSVEDICRWYGVPPHKVQHLLRSTFNNIEHLGIEFARDALTPWALRMEQEADFKFFPVRGQKRSTKFDMGWLTHGDAKSRFEAYQIGLDRGVWTVNEVRAFEGKNSIGKLGDTRLVPLNMTTLEAKANTPADAETKKALPAPGAGDGDSQPGQADAGAGGTESAQNAVLGAIHMMLEGELERYGRRMKNREADLRRGGATEQKVQGHLVEERAKQRPKLVEACGEALDLAAKWLPGVAKCNREAELLKAADAVDNGAAAGSAAMEMLERFRAVENA